MMARIHFASFAFHERISGGNTEIEKNKQQLVTRANKQEDCVRAIESGTPAG
jgi:hypothetical protein